MPSKSKSKKEQKPAEPEVLQSTIANIAVYDREVVRGNDGREYRVVFTEIPRDASVAEFKIEIDEDRYAGALDLLETADDHISGIRHLLSPGDMDAATFHAIVAKVNRAVERLDEFMAAIRK